VIIICTTCLKQVSAFCPQCIYGFRMILRINSDYFLKQHWSTDLCNEELLFSLMMFCVSASCRLVGTCQRFRETYCLYLQPWRWLNMETVCFSETLLSTDESTRRQNPEEQHRHPHCRENLKSHTVFLCLHAITYSAGTQLWTSWMLQHVVSNERWEDDYESTIGERPNVDGSGSGLFCYYLSVLLETPRKTKNHSRYQLWSCM
jgi:hypothetical protein